MKKSIYLSINRLLALLILVIVAFSPAGAHECRVPTSIRFTLEREGSSCPIIYYFSMPESVDGETYPILVLCDGSESQGSEGSILFVRDFFADHVQALHVGYLTIEKCGIDGNEIDHSTFWKHYTRSQRLQDHIQVIRHLEQNPPARWNGQFIFAGVSEGGSLVTDLSIICPNTLATINWSGAKDWSWADELWHFFQNFGQWPPDVPTTRTEFDALVQEIIANPSPDLWMGGMTYLYHADAFQKPPINYSQIKAPFLVVTGAEDCIVESSDQFVEKGLDAGAPLTYFRVDGMDHYIRKRPDIIAHSFDWLQHQIADHSENI